MIIGEEDRYARQFGVKTYSEDMLERIKNSETADIEKIIMGVASYRMLDSLQY